jgi:hypothetical protein
MPALASEASPVITFNLYYAALFSSTINAKKHYFNVEQTRFFSSSR